MPRTASLLILPALLLVAAAFLAPLAYLLSLAIRSPELPPVLPRTTALLRTWDRAALPSEPTYAAMAQELAAAEATQSLGPVSSRLNFERPGLRTLLLRTARAPLAAPYAQSMPALNPAWADPALWRLIQDAASPLTPTYMLRALDLQASQGGLAKVPSDQAVFLPIFVRTFVIAGSATAICLLLAYPVAYVLATLPRRWAGIGMAFVLIPFWTSILVRSIAWFLILQRDGPVNATLLALGLVETPVTMIFTRFAVLLAMVHVLLPFAVMPLYSVLRGQDRALPAAAASLGAPPWRAFWRITLPLSTPGVLAAGLITFMLGVGFYITPALVGGPGDQMISSFIAFYTNASINWGMASALAVLLLAFTFALVALARRAAPAGVPVR